jgi:hypothetical protein
MSGGQELEDIQEYNRLYSILQGVQGSRLTVDENSSTQHEPGGVKIYPCYAPPQAGGIPY